MSCDCVPGHQCDCMGAEQEFAKALVEWYDTTHSIYLYQHDHHCPVNDDQSDDESCTCGYSGLLRAERQRGVAVIERSEEDKLLSAADAAYTFLNMRPCPKCGLPWPEGFIHQKCGYE